MWILLALVVLSNLSVLAAFWLVTLRHLKQSSYAEGVEDAIDLLGRSIGERRSAERERKKVEELVRKLEAGVEKALAKRFTRKAEQAKDRSHSTTDREKDDEGQDNLDYSAGLDTANDQALEMGL